jgi:hypothetical protein
MARRLLPSIGSLRPEHGCWRSGGGGRGCLIRRWSRKDDARAQARPLATARRHPLAGLWICGRGCASPTSPTAPTANRFFALRRGPCVNPPMGPPPLRQLRSLMGGASPGSSCTSRTPLTLVVPGDWGEGIERSKARRHRAATCPTFSESIDRAQCHSPPSLYPRHVQCFRD